MLVAGAVTMDARNISEDIDDRMFAAFWLVCACLCHAYNLLPLMCVRFGSVGFPQAALLAVSAVSLGFIMVWSLLCLRLQLGGDGRTTLLGVAVILAATVLVLMSGAEDVAVRRMVCANAVAAFAMLGRTFPVGVFDGLFATRRRPDDQAA